MAREDLHFRLRIPEYLKELVERAATEKGDSMTAEIIRRLHTSFDEDHATLEIPRDLQDRIRRYAERHQRSLNGEIVRILEREFPPPASIEGNLSEMLELISMLRDGRSGEFFGRFSEELISTLRDVANGRIKVDEDIRREVEAALGYWNEARTKENWRDYSSQLDEEEVDSLVRSGTTAKYIDPEFPDEK